MFSNFIALDIGPKMCDIWFHQTELEWNCILSRILFSTCWRNGLVSRVVSAVYYYHQVNKHTIGDANSHITVILQWNMNITATFHL